MGLGQIVENCLLLGFIENFAFNLRIPALLPSCKSCGTTSHCNTLQHATIHYLQHTHCNARTATHCNTLQHTATNCNTLQHTATHCNTLQHATMHYLQHTHCNARTATHCNTLHPVGFHLKFCSQP